MSTKTMTPVIGDVVKWELPNELCRAIRRVKRNLTATAGLNVGQIIEPATAVAQVHTYTCVAVADGGTFKLGYKGQWTTAIAWDATVATIKTAFELLSTVTDTITVSGASGLVTTVTITWGTAGKKDEIRIDARLLTDGGVVMEGDSAIAVTTVGSVVATDVIALATGANATGILLEEVTLDDLKTLNDIKRAFLVKGDAIVDGDKLLAVAAQLVAGKAALVVLGITIRTEPTIYQAGPPTS